MIMTTTWLIHDFILLYIVNDIYIINIALHLLRAASGSLQRDKRSRAFSSSSALRSPLSLALFSLQTMKRARSSPGSCVTESRRYAQNQSPKRKFGFSLLAWLLSS